MLFFFPSSHQWKQLQSFSFFYSPKRLTPQKKLESRQQREKKKQQRVKVMNREAMEEGGD